MKSVISTQTKETHKRILKEKTDTNFYYQRFDVDGLGDIKHDSWKPKQSGTAALHSITEYTRRYLDGDKVRDELRECARKLVESRRRRALTPYWESFATRTPQV